MRLFELKHNYPSTPLVYVDMDGVLADFFGAVAKIHGVSDWREIRRKHETDVRAAKLPGFFEKLDTLPHALELIQGLMRIAGSYNILSSPLQSDVEKSVKEKSHWIANNLKAYSPQEELFSHTKYRYAKQADGTPNILIDDYPTNIELWEAHGGIGILYKDSDFSEVLDKVRAALEGEPIKESTDPRVRYGSSYILPENRSDSGERDLPIGDEISDSDPSSQRINNKLYTARAVLKYVQGLHHEYHLEEPILNNKIWMLVNYPVDKLNTPENSMFDDPYKRIIDIDLDHVKHVSKQDIERKPIVAVDGWVLDGNHRATKAMMLGLDTIPAFVPYSGK
jgi:5'(3')-deoxyribonucleotidase